MFHGGLEIRKFDLQSCGYIRDEVFVAQAIALDLIHLSSFIIIVNYRKYHKNKLNLTPNEWSNGRSVLSACRISDESSMPEAPI